MSEYRCEASCLNCGHYWVTRKRNTTSPPARCPNCNSSKTYVIRSFNVSEKEDDNVILENMLKEYIKNFGEEGML